MKQIIDIHHHLDTLNFLFRSRGLLQNHLMTINQHTRRDYKITLSVSLYPNIHHSFDDLRYSIQKLKKEIEDSGNDVILITRASDLDRHYKLGIILHVESARILKNFESELPELFDLGVRGIIPMHFIDNHLGTSCDDPLRRIGIKEDEVGLSTYGEKFVHKCNELGMWVDVTHTTDKAGEDILTIGNKVIVSHVGIRDIKDLMRNKPIQYLKKIAGKGGLIGLTPWQHLIGTNSLDYKKHFEFGKNNGLGKSLCIGSDFGAPIKTLPSLNNLFKICDFIDDDNFAYKNSKSFLTGALP